MSSRIHFVMSFVWFAFCSSCSSFPPSLYCTILGFKTILFCSFCVGVIYDVSWAFPPKKITEFLTRSQIEANHELGFQNRCFLFPFDFPLIGFKLGNDLLGVAHLLSCDHVVKFWWQLFWFGHKLGGFWLEAIFWMLCSCWFVIHGQSGVL
jgi:hypothetical protein